MGSEIGKGGKRTLQFLIKLAERHHHSLNMLAVVQVLLGLRVAFVQRDFYCHHLFTRQISHILSRV